MQLMHVFQVLLLVAIVAGSLMSWDRRKRDERRDADRGVRREADAPDAQMSEPAAR